MAKQVCENCGRIQEVFGPKITFTEVDGKAYCEDCVGDAQKGAIIKIDQANLSDSEKMTMMIEILESIEESAVEQEKHLKTIKNIITIIVVFAVIAAIFQGCSVL